ncbi:MAG: tRNA (N(6)-L-threonylcarbamoyladenosine(37)-C(2))-methylthiotransferase MtaB [Alphaproteobacteria bacterium]|nr:tRNA (N(6)-L-threonylcarbamoyladenosine(37)-C(2))-methylthiotransferase MtaB [Alphaproteobacteria bacterium]
MTEIVTFGCRLNAYESEAMKARAAEAGLNDAIIFNTCAVTAEAVRQSRQQIRKARREHPGAKIIVTGCAAQTEPGTYAAMDEVDLVLGNSEKLQARSYAAFGMDAFERVRVNDIMSVKETAGQFVDSFDGRARAFLQVQNGCDHRCTFCIIPYGRGNSRSVPVGEVISEARRLAETGFPEIVLTGVDLTAYGADLPGTPTLGQLVRRLLKLVPGLKRLRISSIDMIEADDDFLRAIADEDRLMPHFHLSVQAGDDMILKRMKRRHSRADVIAFCDRVREMRPDAAFGADIIAGFPTETDAMFENSRALISDAGLTYLHVFPFSPRKGTPAARMPQLPREVVKARAKVLRTEGERALAARLQNLQGRDHDVLVEKAGSGHTPCFAPVRLSGDALPGSIVRIRAIAATKSHLIAA